MLSGDFCCQPSPESANLIRQQVRNCYRLHLLFVLLRDPRKCYPSIILPVTVFSIDRFSTSLFLFLSNLFIPIISTLTKRSTMVPMNVLMVEMVGIAPTSKNRFDSLHRILYLGEALVQEIPNLILIIDPRAHGNYKVVLLRIGLLPLSSVHQSSGERFGHHCE